MAGTGGGKRGKGRGKGGAPRGPAVRDRLQTLLLVLVLLGAGALLGSFWLEWRDAASPSGGAAVDPAAEGPLEGRPRVEVLNGSGDRGAARRAAEVLRDRGFDVVYFGNASHFEHDVTHVLDRSGRPQAAAEVARVLSRDSAVTDLDSTLYLDATVILGSDWREALAEPGQEVDARRR